MLLQSAAEMLFILVFWQRCLKELLALPIFIDCLAYTNEDFYHTC